MIPPRVIPILGIINRKLVKTVRYKKPKYIGDPINAIKIFNDKAVDELAIINIRATVDNKEPDYDHLFEMAGEAFMPIAYGGGIKTFNQAKKIFDCGVEKVIINTSFFENPSLVNEIAETYGSQSIIISLDLTKNLFGKNIICSNSGKVKIKSKLTDVLNQLKKAPVGEILVNDIHKEGTFSGYNLNLLKEVSGAVSVPTISNCGASTTTDFQQALISGASAVAASSMFVYRNQNPDSILISYKSLT